MRTRLLKPLLISTLIVTVLVGSPLSVAAVQAGDEDSPESTTHLSHETTEKHTTEDRDVTTAQTHAEDKTLKVQKRLDDAKLRVCERRQTQIKTIMERSSARAKRQAELFNAIAERTKAFYVKQGHTLANYDELVAAVDGAKNKVAADVATLPRDFSCESSDPKGTGSSFKEGMKQEITDLKALRTAVKNLIVGVKSVQPHEEDN